LNFYKNKLTKFELTEFMQFETFYTIGKYRRSTLYEIADAKGDYKVEVGEHICYRF